MCLAIQCSLLGKTILQEVDTFLPFATPFTTFLNFILCPLFKVLTTPHMPDHQRQLCPWSLAVLSTSSSSHAYMCRWLVWRLISEIHPCYHRACRKLCPCLSTYILRNEINVGLISQDSIYDHKFIEIHMLMSLEG